MKKGPEWRDTSEGLEKYQAARAEAQRLADADGFDRRLEANDIFQTWEISMLPSRENRYGYERRVEVVSCSDTAKCQPGHGPDVMGAEIKRLREALAYVRAGLNEGHYANYIDAVLKK